MAGTGAQICLDALYRLDALIYGIRKYQVIAQQQTLERYKYYGHSIEGISTHLKVREMTYSHVLFQILEEQTSTVIQGDEDTEKLEKKMRNGLGTLFGSFVSTVELLARQVGKIAEVLLVDDRVRVDDLHLILAGDTRLEQTGGLELMNSKNNQPEGSLKSTMAPFYLPKSEERFRQRLKADIESTTDLSHFNEMYKRVHKAITTGKAFPKLMEELESLSERIKIIWHRNLPDRKTRDNKGLKHISRVREDLSILSSVIGNQGMTCRCKENHHGLLLVEDVFSENDHDPAPTFQLMFHNRQKRKFTFHLNHWKQIAWRSAKLSASVLPDSPNDRSTATKIESTLKTARIALPGGPKRADTAQLTSIKNLCSAIGRWEKEKHLATIESSQGWLGDNTKQIKVCFHRPASTQPDTPAPFTKYLVQAKTALSINEKLHLALRIASSLLYLGGSGWLQSQWTSEDFWTPSSGAEPATPDDIYVAMTPVGNVGTDVSHFWGYARTIMDLNLVSLGFFLVELAFGEPWLEIRQNYKPGYTDNTEKICIADLEAMHMLLNDALNESIPFAERPLRNEGPMFVDAIRRCVQGNIEGKKASLEDSSFREEFYDRVIRSLKDAIEDYEFDLAWAPSKSIPTIRLFDDKDVDPGMESRATEWFNKYNEVARFFEKCTPAIGCERRVKVAILDSGIDNSNSMISREQPRIRCTSCLKHNTAVEDSHGHGTHVAGLVLRVAKNVDIHVFRVTENDQVGENTIETIADALNQAIKDEVDIISLSLGYPYHTQEFNKIQEAIKTAYNKNIVIFAAAGNAGANERIAYPADQDEVIWIGSSDGLGNRSSFTPLPKASGSKYGFITVGEGVKSAWPRKIGGREFQTRSGTSYATPIVAGIAAAVMDFMRFKRWNPCPHSRERFLLGKMRSKKGIQAILNEMADKTPDGYHYINPWKLFDSYSEARSDIIADVLEHILE